MEYRCPAQLKQGGQCFRTIRGLYGLYCGTHKHLHFHKKLVETESEIKAQLHNLKTQVTKTQTALDQHRHDINEYKEEIKDQLSDIYYEGSVIKNQLQVQGQAINVLAECVDPTKLKAGLERRSIKWIDYGQIREDRIQRYFQHCQSQREKKMAQCRDKLKVVNN
jgi:septal ring factor EnvC (AmiA/AmiB activator)